MAVVEGGSSGIVAEVGIFSAQKPLHVAPKPIPYDQGHYRFSMVTGTLAAALAASAVVFSARWSDSAKVAIVTSFRLRFLPLTPFTAATLTDHTSFDALLAVTFTAAHTGGTNIATGTTAALKVRQSMSASLFGDLRIATTAALGGGAGLTLAPYPFAQSLRKGNRVNPAAATEEVIMPVTDGLNLDYNASAGEHPIVLAQNEGIVVRNRTVWPAAGTGILLVEMAWGETSAY